jgi:hypothetical protein
MRWRTAGLCALSLLTLTGCPEEFGKEGRIQRAAHRDALELIQKHCTQAEYERYCEGGRERTAKCIEECGG